MPRYVIERRIPGVGALGQEELRAVSQQSCAVLQALGSGIRWDHSYVTTDAIFCVYEAESEELVREHARQGGFPADSVNEVKNIISPATAG